MHLPLALTPEEVATLEACSLRGPHPRQRRRAQALLGHHRGQSLPSLARFFAVRYDTVRAWYDAWQAHGLAGLAEGARSGRPPKVTEDVKKK